MTREEILGEIADTFEEIENIAKRIQDIGSDLARAIEDKKYWEKRLAELSTKHD